MTQETAIEAAPALAEAMSGSRSIAAISLDSEARFINRELSWLAFNERVLEEAFNPHHPLLERLRFLSISATNLDEFYMVRVAGLKGQVNAGVAVPSQDGMTPAQQLAGINTRVGELMQNQQIAWQKLRLELREAGISVIDVGDLKPAEQRWLDQYFMEQIFPILTPLAVDPAHPFPFIPNLGFSLVLHLVSPGEGRDLKALLPLPNMIDRFVRLPGKEVRFLPLEELIGCYLDHLFPGFQVAGSGYFRIIRDSEMEIEEEAEDLVRLFETALKRRRRGNVIRLAVNTAMPEDLREFVITQLKCTMPAFVLDGLLGLSDISQLIVDERPDLKFPPYNARFPERIRDFGGDCFAAISAKDIIVHHPFESFDVVV
jgi:polyphosphate kinase